MNELTSCFPRGVIPERCIKFYIAQISEALHYMHMLGLIYRDLKPNNVMLDVEGNVKLADLGGVSDFCSDIKIARSEKKSVRLSEKPTSTAAFTSVYGTASPVANIENLEKPVFRRTILGSPG